MGHSFLLDVVLFRGGALAHRRCSPRSLAGAWVLLQGFFVESAGVRGVSFSRHQQYFRRPRRCHAHVLGTCLHPVHF
jgi:hypothetical protein